MKTYVILSRLSSGAIREPADIKEQAGAVYEKISWECPGVVWKNSYATLGRFDVVDFVESDDPTQIEKAAMIINAYGHATTETLMATPWKQFLETL